MGCDIHAHVEVKINGQWLHWNHPKVGRHYALFARMAGVRNSDNVETISQPRGIPADATETTKAAHEFWNGDAHSASWLTAAEVDSLEGYVRSLPYAPKDFDIDDVFGYIFGNGWSNYKYRWQGTPAGFEDARLVFWFDN